MKKQGSSTVRAVKVELEEDVPPPVDLCSSCDSKLLKCDVCGGPCFTKNFGANACRACAGRCHASQHSSAERFRDDGTIDVRRYLAAGKTASKDFRTFPACKCCRFRRCIKVGMQITGVAFSVPAPVLSTSNESTYLERLAAYRRTLFLQRIRFLTEDGDCPRRFQTTTKTLGDRITGAELKILKEYFSGFEDIWRFLRSDVTHDALTTHYFAAYALLEIVLTTSRNLGYRPNVIFTTVETWHSTMADDIAENYNAWYFGSNIDTIARQAADMWTCALNVAERIRQSFLDDLETAALTQLLFAQYEFEFFEGEAGRAAFVGSILNGLWCHYGQTSVDCTTSFDRLALILVHFNELWYKFCQVMVIIDLHIPKNPHLEKSAPRQACRNDDAAAVIPGNVVLKTDCSLDYASSELWPAKNTADGIFSASVCARANEFAI